jgi:acyl dehydratase
MPANPEWTVAVSSAGALTVARTYEITVRMAQAYAAGVGDLNPLYFNDDSPAGIIAPPCLLYSLQWNARAMPDADEDPALAIRGVHASSDLQFVRPLRAGDVVTVQGQRISLQQRRPGVYVLTRFRIVDSGGETVATMDEGLLLRDCRLGGPDVSLEEAVPPPQATGDERGGWSTSVAIAREAPHVYTECADIWNPIHTERRWALAAGLPDIILHGSATMAIAARELVNRIGDGDPARLRRLGGQFRAMVIPGTAIRIECAGVSSSPDGDKTAFFAVLNADGSPAVKDGFAVFGE